MATVKLILDTKHPRKDGTCSIKVQIGHKQRTADINTRTTILPKYWTGTEIKKNCPGIDNVRRTNTELSTKVNEAWDIIDHLDDRNALQALTVQQLRDYIKHGKNAKTSNALLLDYCRSVLPSYKNAGSRKRLEMTIIALEDFLQGQDIYLEEIDKAWLYRYKAWRSEKNTHSTTNIDLRNLRAIYNRAIDVDQVVDQSFYPFRKFQFFKAEPRNLRLPLSTIRAIRDYKPATEAEALARDFFMLSFYFIGINNGDLYNVKNIEDGRIYYKRNKTNKNYSIKVEPEAQAIIDARSGVDTLLIYSERYKSRAQLNKGINGQLRKIGENEKINVYRLTMYHARHSWTGIAAKHPIGAGKDLLAQALGHGKVTVTDTYFDYDTKLVDDLNRKVIDLLYQPSKKK